VKALDNGEKIPATFVDRGLRLYDTPYARGAPSSTSPSPGPALMN